MDYSTSSYHTILSGSRKNTAAITWAGIFLSLFSISIINLVVAAMFGTQQNNLQKLTNELCIFGMVAFLLFYIIPREGRTPASIGLHNKHWGTSLLWALLLVVIGFALILCCIELSKFLGWRFGESTAFAKLSPLTVTLITLRAGIAEEVFMRGYVLERLTDITGKKWVAFLISTLVFGVLHYSQGYAGILIATMAGAMFSLFYFWKKDLKANIIAHFLIDFVPNVLVS